ncbi:HAUS augmin-like complex subunit 6 isoform X2 [Microcaecilia unicolor]|uniref:HAUS augmin-like complex subunit 6 isoform X2 n=1 Tax=Microcaecilia unicolor TaxID=1415580 RepID=A0A6P7X3C2_9AMPH|nr:HAUS augmin-like complex subunit 6 isoform X2 [Microcaecilia unicolor]
MSGAAAGHHTWQKDHLWLYLQALGFEAGAACAAAGKFLTHVTLGVNMFDKPNKDAFSMTAHFLFSKLDSSKCKETFRFCWPPLDKKRDAEFRKLCCEWLKKISDECGSCFPQVVASLFLSPGGPKFVHLMYHFARYVVLQHIKRETEGGNACFYDSLNSKPQDLQKALARNKVAHNRFLQVIQREDTVIQEYQQKAQLMVKQIRELRSERAALQSHLQKLEAKEDHGQSRAEKIQKVRDMWSSIMEMLSFLAEEKEAVDSVVQGHVDQYTLDGASVTLNVPRLLVDKIENEMHKLHIENVYEAGKLNFITIIQLLNEALKMLRHERHQVDHKGLKLDIQYIEGKTKFEAQVLSRLRHMRHKIRREDLVSVNRSIAEKENEWDMKWERVLGQSPFNLIKSLNPVLDLHPAITHFSFDPATEEALKSSLFCQYPASLPDSFKKDSQAKKLRRDEDGLLRNTTEVMPPTSNGGRIISPVITSGRNNVTLLGKDSPYMTPDVKTKCVAQITSVLEMGKTQSEEIRKIRKSLVTEKTCTVRQDDPLQKARKQLAEQVADEIVSDSPMNAAGGMELDDIIGLLASNPFLTRKQIPRTPENLISDIRSSWRKAIHTEDPLEMQKRETQEVPKESEVELDLAHGNQIDLSLACFLSTSHIIDPNDPLEVQPSLSWEKPVPCEPEVFNSTDEFKVCNPVAGLTRFEGPPPEYENGKTVFDNCTKENELDGAFDLPIAHKSIPLGDSPHADVKITDIIQKTSLVSQANSSRCTTLSWDASQMMGDADDTDSHEVIQFSIQHETLPEEAEDLSLNSSRSPETDDEAKKQSKCTENEHSFSEDKVTNMQAAFKPKMDLQAIRCRYEALKNTFKNTITDYEEGIYQSPVRRFVKQRSESNLLQKKVDLEDNDMFSPIDKFFTIDFDGLKTPSRLSMDERKLSLPQLISFSPVEEDLSSRKPGVLHISESPAKQ